MIFLSTTGDVLNAAQQTAFENYIQGGGGYTGIHAAADTEYDWKWYGRLVGAYFLSHPPGTPEADVIVEDADDHTTEHLDGPIWHRTDEWYNYKPRQLRDRRATSTTARATAASTSSSSSTSRRTTSRTATRRMTTIRSRGASATTVAARGTRAWATPPRRSAEADYLEHILGGIEVSAGVADSAECGAADPNAPIVEAFGEPTSGTAPLTVQFSSSALDPNGPGSGLRYRWEFGDG